MRLGSPSRGQYQPLNQPYEETRTSTWQPTRYREHMKYGKNPDQFYVDIYDYHQAGGFWSVLLTEALWTVKFVFVIFVGVELTVCTRWNVLTNSSVPVNQWSDVFTPPGQCWASLPLLPSLLVAGAVLALFIQMTVAVSRLRRFWETRLFCTYILNMPTSCSGLSDMTWSEVQRRLIASQPPGNIDELSICHRIVRHENYLIAMIDQDILPVRFNLSSREPPMTYVYLPESYLFNIKLLLFWTPWSPFSGYWILKTEYKEINRRHELALHLAKMSRIFGLLNLLLAPIILLSQFLVFICSNAERIRYQPSSIMGRRWSNYATLYLRHYNELRHQFLVRIGLAYEPACQYLDCFVSRNLISLAETVAFVFGSASVAFFLLGMIHEQVLHLSGYWAILVLGGLLARACLSYIPNESSVRSPRALLVTILGKIHHFRDHWIEQGETSRVCSEFSQLFQYRLCAAIEDLVSALITPFILIFVVPDHALEIVDFLRNYTVELKELGDVCSFAQLDIRRHGDPNWKFFGCPDEDDDHAASGAAKPSIEDPNVQPLIPTGGKAELSLMHFHLNNPECTLPSASRAYLESIRLQLLRDMTSPIVQPTLNLATQRPLNAELFSSLYGASNASHPAVQPHVGSLSPFASAEFSSNLPLKNASHLPGPGHVDGKSLGFVGALVESMRQSMHKSDPGMIHSAASDSTILKTRGTSAGREFVPITGGSNNVNDLPGATSAPTDRADLPISTQTGGMDTVNDSLMMASIQFSANVSGFPAYRPYVSQIENGSSQNWGLGTSYALGHSINKHGLTELLTADTSASILYMHELAHRRRLQRSIDQSSIGARPMGRSSLAGVSESAYGPNQPAPYQLSQTSSPSVRIVGGRSSMYTTRTANDRGFLAYTNYGATTSGEPVGIIRTSSDRGIISRPAVDKVAEEDELGTTPRGPADAGLRAIMTTVEGGRHPVPYGSVISSSPSPMVPPTPHGTGAVDETRDLERGLNEETDTEHLWPDLPPTNC